MESRHQEKMLGHVARWESGVLTKRNYYTRARIDYNQFHYWCRVSKGLTRKAAAPSSGFLPVRLTHEAEHLPAISKIVVTGAFGPETRFPVCEASFALIRQLLNS